MSHLRSMIDHPHSQASTSASTSASSRSVDLSSTDRHSLLPAPHLLTPGFARGCDVAGSARGPATHADSHIHGYHLHANGYGDKHAPRACGALPERARAGGMARGGASNLVATALPPICSESSLQRSASFVSLLCEKTNKPRRRGTPHADYHPAVYALQAASHARVLFMVGALFVASGAMFLVFWRASRLSGDGRYLRSGLQ
ncbi:hypothetical protein B0H19DRAFT_1269175 [Mycena capillaripes]|nr:hypothetical protein B0H19DRAFT_1269175 [Mycena capillaripes]